MTEELTLHLDLEKLADLAQVGVRRAALLWGWALMPPVEKISMTISSGKCL
jgi:hypothetical protein